MKESLKAMLWVNNRSVELNAFVEEFLARTVLGATSSLKGADEVRNLELYLEGGKVRVIVNENALPLTPFPNDIIANTLIGLVSSLKEVNRIDNLKVQMKVLREKP